MNLSSLFIVFDEVFDWVILLICLCFSLLFVLNLVLLFFIRGLVTLFKQRGSIICAFFLSSVLYIEELPLLEVAQQVCGSCFLSMCFACQLSGTFYGFHWKFNIYLSVCLFDFVYRSWGFLCPVHTPDGEPCGLLNHMTCSCRKSAFY